jgi:hypothetical protein
VPIGPSTLAITNIGDSLKASPEAGTTRTCSLYLLRQTKVLRLLLASENTIEEP